MIISIDFNSNEAIYIQLRNQIVLSIAREQLSDGESLPSVRQLAEELGVNMHTVNKAYNMLRQEGYLTLDRRKGAVVSVDMAERNQKKEDIYDAMQMIAAEAICKGISLQEMQKMMEDIYLRFEQL